jgi:Ni2+-binding GTPase involved in maturation of urease and hydrogenase
MKMTKEGFLLMTIAVIGPKGNGKTHLLPSLIKTFGKYFLDALVDTVNT